MMLADVGHVQVRHAYRGFGLKPTGHGFSFSFEAGGAEDSRVLGGEVEEEAILVGHHRLVRGVVNGN
jgi:hypothetical protein